MSKSVDFEGLEEFYSWTEKAAGSIEKDIADALMSGGLKLEASAKRNTPVDTGRLRDSITTQAKDNGLTVEVGTNVEYAEFVHNGARGRMPRPFLEQAWEQNKDKIIAEIGSAVEKGLK